MTNDSQVQPRSVAGYATVATTADDIKRLVGAFDGTIDHTFNLMSISHYYIDELEHYIKPCISRNFKFNFTSSRFCHLFYIESIQWEGENTKVDKEFQRKPKSSRKTNGNSS